MVGVVVGRVIEGRRVVMVGLRCPMVGLFGVVAGRWVAISGPAGRRMTWCTGAGRAAAMGGLPRRRGVGDRLVVRSRCGRTRVGTIGRPRVGVTWRMVAGRAVTTVGPVRAGRDRRVGTGGPRRALRGKRRVVPAPPGPLAVTSGRRRVEVVRPRGDGATSRVGVAGRRAETSGRLASRPSGPTGAVRWMATPGRRLPRTAR
jgi:hypothetical protein